MCQSNYEIIYNQTYDERGIGCPSATIKIMAAQHHCGLSLYFQFQHRIAPIDRRSPAPSNLKIQVTSATTHLEPKPANQNNEHPNIRAISPHRGSSDPATEGGNPNGPPMSFHQCPYWGNAPSCIDLWNSRGGGSVSGAVLAAESTDSLVTYHGSLVTYQC